MSTMTRLAALKAAAERATKGPWVMGRHQAETKDAMIAYVINCIEVSPLADRFFMVGTDDWRADICHTGNGPTSEANGHYLALCSPDTILALVACAEALQTIRYNHSFHDAPRDALTVKQCDAALAALEQA